MELSKFAKGARIIDKVLKVFQSLAVAGVIASVIFIPLTLIFGEEVVAKSSSLQLGLANISIEGDFYSYINPDRVKLSIIVMLISVIIALALLWNIFRVFRNVLAPMKEGVPFEEGISLKVKKLGWVVIIGGTIGEFCGAVAEAFQLRAFDWVKLLDANVVTSINYDYTIDGKSILVGLVILFLSFIFKYGEELQKQADETL